MRRGRNRRTKMPAEKGSPGLWTTNGQPDSPFPFNGRKKPAKGTNSQGAGQIPGRPDFSTSKLVFPGFRFGPLTQASKLDPIFVTECPALGVGIRVFAVTRAGVEGGGVFAAETRGFIAAPQRQTTRQLPQV